MQRSKTPLFRCCLAACGALVAPATASAQSAELPNPFAGFESFMLPNGITVWYRHMAGSPTTSMTVIVPAGGDDDPRGREQTAHLLEHVLLSDRHGRTEAELARALTERGGTFNGITTPDHSYYPVHVATSEAAFALEWLHGVVAPRVFTDALVDQNREPVAIETGARRRSVIERLAVRYVHLPALLPPGFWRREFRLDTPADRFVDPYEALERITAADLQLFYDRYYATPTMTLVIISGAPRGALQPAINATFATMPWRPPAAREHQVAAVKGESRRFSYRLGRSTRLSLLHRVEALDGRDLLRLIFIEDLLRLRLTERLRRGADKFIYSADVTMETRSGAAFLRIALDVDPVRERQVRRIIDDELQRIRTAHVDTAAFYADRNALDQRLRVHSAAPGRLIDWAASRFYDPSLHDAFPDVGEYYATVGPDSIAALAQRVFTLDNRITRVLRPPPLALHWIALIALVVITATAALYRRRTFRDVDMGTIRYVGRIRTAPAARILYPLGVVLVLLVGGRLAAAGIQFVAEYVVLPSDSVLLHAGAAVLLIAGVTLLCFTGAGMLITKVLVFGGEIRLKSPTWRSIAIPGRDVKGARIVRSRHGLRLRRPAPIAGGEGVFVELADGAGYLLHVRRPEALRAAVESLAARSTIPGADPDPTVS